MSLNGDIRDFCFFQMLQEGYVRQGGTHQMEHIAITLKKIPIRAGPKLTVNAKVMVQTY